MAGCFSFFIKIFSVIIMLVALILTGLSNGGSRTKSIGFNTNTYLFKIDLSHVVMDKVFSIEDSNISELGISQVYSFGLWGYCKGERTGAYNETNISTKQQIKEWFTGEDYNVTYCSPPESLFTIDIVKVLLEDTPNASSVTITLPTAVTNQSKLISGTGRGVFVVLMMGVASLGLAMLLTLFSFLFPVLFKIAICFDLLALLTLIIGAASSQVVFTKVKNNFNNEATTYGILATLGSNKFYAMLWAAVVLTFIATIINFFSFFHARSSTSRGQSRTQMSQEEKPFMGYEEK